MFQVRRTAQFVDWLKGLRDVEARARIARRIDRLALDHFGDMRPVGGGVRERRFDFGPGDRVYLTRRGDVLVILLCSGDKSTQARDIARARSLAREV